MGKSDNDMTRGRVRAIELKQALAADVDASGRSHASIADDCDVSRQALDAFCDTHVDSHLPGARWPQFIRATGGRHTLACLCGLVDLVPVKLPDASTESVDVCATADMAESFAAALRKHAHASRDGRWTATEAADMAPVLTELAARAMALKSYIERQAKVEPIGGRRQA